uniref:Uncharacterized protein n=1 Tax=Sphaerodactylus townsendi TaxID=933632 RepID=A0ACB8FIX3_9SAUR
MRKIGLPQCRRRRVRTARIGGRDEAGPSPLKRSSSASLLPLFVGAEAGGERLEFSLAFNQSGRLRLPRAPFDALPLSEMISSGYGNSPLLISLNQ